MRSKVKQKSCLLNKNILTAINIETKEIIVAWEWVLFEILTSAYFLSYVKEKDSRNERWQSLMAYFRGWASFEAEPFTKITEED